MSISVTGVTPQWTVGDRLRKAREMIGLDRAELAEQIGISRNTVTMTLWIILAALTFRRVALVLALAVVMYVGLVADPVQWWLTDLSTALSSGGSTP